MENREENTNSVSHPLPPPPNPTDPVSLSLSLSHTHTHRHPSQVKLSSEGGRAKFSFCPPSSKISAAKLSRQRHKSRMTNRDQADRGGRAPGMEINGGFFSRIFLHPKLINSQLLSAQTHMYYSAFTPSLPTPTYVKRSPAPLPTPPPHLFPSVESDGKKKPLYADDCP